MTKRERVYFRVWLGVLALYLAITLSGCSTVGDVLDDGVDRCCGAGDLACAAVVAQLNAAIAPNEIHVHCAIPTP